MSALDIPSIKLLADTLFDAGGLIRIIYLDTRKKSLDLNLNRAEYLELAIRNLVSINQVGRELFGHENDIYTIDDSSTEQLSTTPIPPAEPLNWAEHRDEITIESDDCDNTEL
jgi:hypothetical protein